MTEATESTKKGKHRPARFLAAACAFLCLALFGAYLLLAVYLATPTAARQASSILSDYLRYPATVAGLGLSGATFSVTGLSIGSPSGFKERQLVSARLIAIRPGWRALLSAGKSFDEIALQGLRITLDKNESGVWNFNELTRLLSGRKGGGETVIKRLAVADSSLSVEGTLFDNLALTATDFSTKGTTGSRLLLTFKDGGGTLVRLEGGARLGADPALDLVVTAPSILLNNYRKFVSKWPVIDLTGGTGAFSLALTLHGGKVAARGSLAFAHAALALPKGRVPLAAELQFSGGYDLKGDEATLDACSLRLNDTVRVDATGTVRQVRTGREFAAAVSLEDAEIGELLAMVPPGVRGDLTAAGELSSGGFRFSGDAAHGITAGGGAISLSRGELAKGGRIIAKELAAAVSLGKGRSGWEVRGTISQGKGKGDEMVQALAARFTALLSGRMRLLQAELPSLTARISGIPAQARFRYRSGAAEPVTGSITIEKAPVAALNRSLAGGKAAFSSGTVALAVQVAGRGARDLRGTLRGSLVDIRGKAGGHAFVIRNGTINADFNASAGKLIAGGKIICNGGGLDGRAIEVASGFRIRDREVFLSDGSAMLDRAKLRFAGIRGPIPVPVKEGDLTRTPLRLHLEGIAAQSGEAEIGGLAGDLAVDYLAGNGRRWLTGSGLFAVKRLSFKGREAGSLAARLKFTESGMTAQLDGKLLEGRLSGTAEADPFGLQKKAVFSLDLDGMQCAGLSSFGPDSQPVKISGGVLGTKLTGGYTLDEGVRCRLEAKGKGIALAGKEGQTLVADGALQTVCELARGTLFIREGTVGSGSGATLKMRGEVARVLSPGREGEISISMPTTPLGPLVSKYASALPKGFREVSATGTLGAQGAIRISPGKIMFDGEASLAEGGFEVPAQKISASDITGTIPVSLAIAGAAGPVRHQKQSSQREDYPAFLSSLRRAAESGRTFRIGTVNFSGLELRETVLGISAGNGLVEITSLESKFLGGTLLGKGFFRSGGEIQYGADLALNDLSLRALCNLYPKIKGYISGRVDGITNFYGEGKGLNGLLGLINIWTRSGPDEKMLVSKEFLQKLAGKKLKGIFFQNDRPYDRGEIRGYLENGYLVFNALDISHTNFFGVKDLSVSVAPVQNKIAIEHLFASIKEAATRGKALDKGEGGAPAPIETEFKWQE